MDTLKVTSATIATALALAATPAIAQDGPASGAQILIVGGFDSVDVGGNSEDVVYGVTAGYDIDLGGAFVGIEAEGSLSGVSENGTGVLVAGDTLTVEAGRDLYIGARLGTMLGESTKVYFKGGYTNTNLDVDYNDNLGMQFSDSEALGGYRVGTGVEFLLGERAVVRAEYRYSDYGDTDLFGFSTGLQTERHQGVVGVGIRF